MGRDGEEGEARARGQDERSAGGAARRWWAHGCAHHDAGVGDAVARVTQHQRAVHDGVGEVERVAWVGVGGWVGWSVKRKGVGEHARAQALGPACAPCARASGGSLNTQA